MRVINSLERKAYMKFSTLMMVCGLVFTQQAFAQNNEKNAADCYAQNANNTKGCTATNNTSNTNNANQQGSKNTVQTTKNSVTTQQSTNNGSKAATQTSKQAEPSSKAAVKTQQQTQKTSTKTTSGRSLILQTQQQLNQLGYNAGPADGLMGTKTREAIKQFQQKNNINVDGKSTSTLLDKMKTMSNK